VLTDQSDTPNFPR